GDAARARRRSASACESGGGAARAEGGRRTASGSRGNPAIAEIARDDRAEARRRDVRGNFIARGPATRAHVAATDVDKRDGGTENSGGDACAPARQGSGAVDSRRAGGGPGRLSGAAASRPRFGRQDEAPDGRLLRRTRPAVRLHR